MLVFDFIQTLFLFSLGITFVLIMLLMYHFKNRMVALEQKHDVLLEILNTLVQETHILKHVVGGLWQQQPAPAVSFRPQEERFAHENKQEIVKDVNHDEEDVEEEEEDEDFEVEEEEEEEEDDDLEEEDEEEEVEVEVEELEGEVKEEVGVPVVDVQKMKLPEMRALVVERGLAADAAKMKKPQLLELLVGGAKAK